MQGETGAWLLGAHRSPGRKLSEAALSAGTAGGQGAGTREGWVCPESLALEKVDSCADNFQIDISTGMRVDTTTRNTFTSF